MFGKPLDAQMVQIKSREWQHNGGGVGPATSNGVLGAPVQYKSKEEHYYCDSNQRGKVAVVETAICARKFKDLNLRYMCPMEIEAGH